jgi:hypothetical protein
MRRSLRIAIIGSALLASAAAADGGRLLLREARGDRIVNLLAAPTPLRAGPASFEVLVQSRTTAEPIEIPRVRLRLTGPERCGTSEISALPEGSRNRGFLGADVRLPMAGTWVVEILLDGASVGAPLRSVFEVGPALPPARRFWPYIAATLLGVALIAVHQALRLRRPHRRSDCGD